MGISRERLETRLAELDQEAEKADRRIGQLEEELAVVRGALANIQGARLVLSELIAEERQD